MLEVGVGRWLVVEARLLFAHSPLGFGLVLGRGLAPFLIKQRLDLFRRQLAEAGPVQLALSLDCLECSGINGLKELTEDTLPGRARRKRKTPKNQKLDLLG